MPKLEPQQTSRLRTIRQAKGMTLRETARAAGLNFAHLSRIERREAQPTVDVLIRLAGVLGIDKLKRELTPYGSKTNTGTSTHTSAGSSRVGRSWSGSRSSSDGLPATRRVGTTDRRTPPALVLEIELEDLPLIRIVSGCDDDDERLKLWLSRSSALAEAVVLLEELKEELRHDELADAGGEEPR